MGRRVFRNYYKGHMNKTKGGGGRQETDVDLAGVGWRDGEKRHTTIIG